MIVEHKLQLIKDKLSKYDLKCFNIGINNYSIDQIKEFKDSGTEINAVFSGPKDYQIAFRLDSEKLHSSCNCSTHANQQCHHVVALLYHCLNHYTIEMTKNEEASKSKMQKAPKKVTEKKKTANSEMITIREEPRPILRLFSDEDEWGDETPLAHILFKYGNYTVPYFYSDRTVGKKLYNFILTCKETGEEICILRSDFKEGEHVKNFMYEFENWSFTDDDTTLIYDEEDDDFYSYFTSMWSSRKTKIEKTPHEMAESILTEDVPFLKEMGWEIDLDPSFPIHGIFNGDDFYLDINESPSGPNDWFDVKMGVMIDGESIDILPFMKKLALMLRKNSAQLDELLSDETVSVKTKDNKIIKIPSKRISEFLKTFMLELATSSDSLRVSRWNATFLNEFEEGEAAAKNRWQCSESLKNHFKKISEGINAPSEAPSHNLQCQLRSYQKEGFNWMQFLRRSGLNGILADEMGLGKTVQTLAHILTEKESKRMQSPVLIVAPTSLMPNWYNEAARFTPTLKVLVLHGNERKSRFSKILDYDIILTTYPLLMYDKAFLLEHEFYMLILDEAQTVKNHKTQAYQVLQQVKASYRLCLSGTPMENHLGELWSLFHFLLPGYLGDHKTFQELFRKPIEKSNHSGRRETLFKRIKPFILRRTKQQVALDLPEKTEIIQRIELKGKQRDLYEMIRIKAQSQLMAEIRSKGLAKSQIAIIDALLKLRQVCCDPRLVKLNTEIQKQESAKLEALMEMVTEMVREGRKILIFSQFTSMLALIEEALQKVDIEYTLLTGNTKDRATPVAKFQEGNISVMLISLKAGGVGLNLTAADTVIHYDPWWNPAVENQASDRAHRMGQKKAVFIYKLVVAGSIEEKILGMQEKKKGLVSSLFEANDKGSTQLTEDDLEMIFQPLPPPV